MAVLHRRSFSPLLFNHFLFFELFCSWILLNYYKNQKNFYYFFSMNFFIKTVKTVLELMYPFNIIAFSLVLTKYTQFVSFEENILQLYGLIVTFCWNYYYWNMFDNTPYALITKLYPNIWKWCRFYKNGCFDVCNFIIKITPSL